MAIGSEEVKARCRASKACFKDEELAKFTGQMDEIINMVQQQLRSRNTTDVPCNNT